MPPAKLQPSLERIAVPASKMRTSVSVFKVTDATSGPFSTGHSFTNRDMPFGVVKTLSDTMVDVGALQKSIYQFPIATKINGKMRSL